jgi:hypothetical protein
MKLLIAILALAVATITSLAQEPVRPATDAKYDAPGYKEIFAHPTNLCGEAESGCARPLLAGDRDFPNFIGFLSNAMLSLDPRALTQSWPLFIGDWTVGSNRVPSGDAQGYGAGLSIAIGERFEIGLNHGGYIMSDFRQSRHGFLNTGGFAQYSLIRDVEDQFIFTAGLQVTTPWLGSTQLLQGGTEPYYLAPYFTFGKEFGEFHVLGTGGYQFPVSSGTTTRLFYANLHFDRRCFGWLYPLVEFNGAWHETNIHATRLDDVPGFFDIARHDFAGNMVTVAPGFNAVLIHDRLEIGAVYQTPIYSEKNFRFHEVLVKMIVRY